MYGDYHSSGIKYTHTHTHTGPQSSPPLQTHRNLDLQGNLPGDVRVDGEKELLLGVACVKLFAIPRITVNPSTWS